MVTTGEIKLVAPTDPVGDWSVYLLWCTGDRLYTGISNQPHKRFKAHRQGKGAKFTRMYPPEQMKIVACCCDKGLALSLECRLKQLTAQQKRVLWASLPLAEQA